MGYGTNWSTPTIIPSQDQSPTTQISYFDDFALANLGVNSDYGQLEFAATGNGGGTLSSAANTATASGRYGIIAVETGTTNNATGQGSFYSDMGAIWCGNGMGITLTFAAQIPILSTATNEFVWEAGFLNQFTNANSANAIAIMYRRTTSTNFCAYTSNNGTPNVVTTSDATFAVTAGTWYNFKIVVRSDGTGVDFYVAPSGVASPIYALLGSSTSNLPDSTHTCFLNHTVYRAATFALRRQALYDWMKLDINFNSPR